MNPSHFQVPYLQPRQPIAQSELHRRQQTRTRRRVDKSRNRAHKQHWRKKDTNKKADSDQCLFFHKRGHFQADCHEYKKAQAKVLEKRGDKDEAEERVNTITLISGNDKISSLCFPHHALVPNTSAW